MLASFKYIVLFILYSTGVRAQIVINELLFNPVREGYDYVEGYNAAGIAVDLSDFRIANRNAGGELSAPRPMARDPVIVGAGRLFVLTGNESWLRRTYNLHDTVLVLQVSSMPSFNNEEGTVVFLTKADSICDEVSYKEDWHFEMLTQTDGVALERIDPGGASNDANNWTSASSSSGYGTPGQVNSHYRSREEGTEAVSVSPPVFSPDNDGVNDFANIRLDMKETGWIANLVIYDAAGRRVKYLLKNQLLGYRNSFKWHGLDDRSQKLASGIYILFTELYNLSGEKRKYKKTVVISNAAY